MTALQKLCLFYAILFLVCGVSFIIAPNFIISLINDLGRWQSNFTELKPSPDRFWVVLSFSMMMMVAYASFMIYRGIHSEAFLNILLLSKFCSSLSYLILVCIEEPAFAYLLGFITDGVIFLSILLLRQKTERV